MGDQVRTAIPAGEHERFAPSAAKSLEGQIVYVDLPDEGKREVGRITGARVVGEGRAIEVEVEIGDEELCEHLRR